MKLKIITTIVLFMTYTASAHAFFDWSDEDALTTDQEFEGNYSGKISMDYEFVEDDILKISVQANDMIVPVLGLAFHLKYPSMNLKFMKYEEGDFLEHGGDPFYLVKDDQSNAALVFGETLRRTDSFPTGKGKIADFYFQVIDGDVHEFYFDKGVVSNLDTSRQDIDRIEWLGIKVEKQKNTKQIGLASSLKLKLFDSKIGLIITAFASFTSAALLIFYLRRLESLRKSFG